MLSSAGLIMSCNPGVYLYHELTRSTVCYSPYINPNEGSVMARRTWANEMTDTVAPSSVLVLRGLLDVAAWSRLNAL